MTQQLKSLINGNHELHPLLAKAHELNALQHHFASVAPPYIAQSCQVLGLHLGTLIVAAANTTVAAKLRQLGPEMAVLLQGRGCEISGIRVKVQVSYNRYTPETSPRKLGESAKNALNDFCQSLPDDSGLRLTLKKLASQKD